MRFRNDLEAHQQRQTRELSYWNNLRMYITLIFETRFHGVKSVFELTYVVKDALELLILRPQYSECWA